MEPPAKRQRLGGGFGHGSVHPHRAIMSDEHGYMDNEQLEGEQDISFEADQDLQYQRAQVDHKLKSTFESIFEKYGRNFDGIGDEIDLRTGEILVNNGHLIKMQDERDAGDATSQSMLDATLDDSDGSVIMLDDLEDEDEDEEGDEGGSDMVGPEEEGGSGGDGSDEVEDSLSDEDMMEDDMILRGFAQASQFIKREQTSDVVDSINNAQDILRSPRQMRGSDSNSQGSALPSRSQILSQFGPQFGPQIVDFVKQRGALNDDSIEPAWRAPPLPQSAYRKPAKIPPVEPLTVTERSPSPEKSVWATEQEPRLRSNFTRADDELLLDFVAKVKELNLEFFAASTWRILERAHPHHSYTVWRRYYRNQLMNRDLQRVDSHISIFALPTLNGTRLEEHSFGNKDVHESCNLPNQVGQMAPSERQRSVRERKPRNRDPTLLDWSEAASAIKTLDPVLHSSILQDMKSPTADRTSSPSQTLQLDLNRSQGCALKNADYNTPRSRSPAPSEKLCPYKDCANGPTMSYRVLRSEDEELSPFCLHLLHIHQATPFPCKEGGCERKGARGFFIETNLLKHVWSAHPYPEALHRLQTREEFSLQDKLGPMMARSQPSNSIASQTLSTPVAQRRHAEFSARSKGTEKAALPFVKSVESTSVSVDITRYRLTTTGKIDKRAFRYKPMPPELQKALYPDSPLSLLERGYSQSSLASPSLISTPKQPHLPRGRPKMLQQQDLSASSQSKVVHKALSRNIVDPSYEFSDEEDVGTSAINTTAIASAVTPYAQSLDTLERYIMERTNTTLPAKVQTRELSDNEQNHVICSSEEAPATLGSNTMYGTEEKLEEAGEAIKPPNPQEQTDDLVEGIARKRQAVRQSLLAEHTTQPHVEEGSALEQTKGRDAVQTTTRSKERGSFMILIETQKRQSFPGQIDSATPSVSAETGSHLKLPYKDAFPIPEGVDAVEWHKSYVTANASIYYKNGNSAAMAKEHRLSGETYKLALDTLAKRRQGNKAKATSTESKEQAARCLEAAAGSPFKLPSGSKQSDAERQCTERVLIDKPACEAQQPEVKDIAQGVKSPQQEIFHVEEVEKDVEETTAHQEKQQPSFTPVKTQKLRDSLQRHSLYASEDDELSLEHPTVLLRTSQLKSDHGSEINSTKRAGYRRNGAKYNPKLNWRKRKLSQLQHEVDELGDEEPPSMPLSRQQQPSKAQRRIENTGSTGKEERPIKRMKAKFGNQKGSKIKSSPTKAESAGVDNVPSPLADRPRKSGPRTPLIDLVSSNLEKDTDLAVPKRVTPSTSQFKPSSTTNLFHANAPAAKAAKFSKSPSKNGDEGAMMETHSDILQKCGNVGFNCSRSFCFKCGPTTVKF